jgi:hypothetical protein
MMKVSCTYEVSLLSRLPRGKGYTLVLVYTPCPLPRGKVYHGSDDGNYRHYSALYALRGCSIGSETGNVG